MKQMRFFFSRVECGELKNPPFTKTFGLLAGGQWAKEVEPTPEKRILLCDDG